MKTKAFQCLVAALLTLAALLAGQSAWATTKTVTYAITDRVQEAGNTGNYIVTMTRSGEVPFDNSDTEYSITMTVTSLHAIDGSSGDYTFPLADGFTLGLSWPSGTNVQIAKKNDIFTLYPTASDNNKKITYSLSCPNNYYVTHVRIKGMEGIWFDHDYDDLHGDNLSETTRYSLQEVSITYSDAPHHAPEDIAGISYNGNDGYYEIPDANALSALATYVNSGNSCAGLTFKMTADIAFPHTTAWDDDSSTENNYTTIGYAYQETGSAGRPKTVYVPFSGTFDGDGHTVSGIRIYRNLANNTCMGMFGDVEGGTVQNVSIADTRITAHSKIGGIIGRAHYSIVTNCHASTTVAFQAVGAGAVHFGGIVGTSEAGTTVSDCTSAAVLTIPSSVETSTCGSFGGIVGNNEGTISGCTAAGVILPYLNADYGGSGAVVGKNKYGGTLTGNTYHSCLAGDTYAFNIGIGTNYSSDSIYITGDVGGISFDRYHLFLYDGRNNTALISAYAKTYNSNGSTAHSGTRPNVQTLTVTLKGRTLYKDGSWNTLCLPFTIESTDLPSSLKTDVSIMELDNGATGGTAFDATTGTLTVNFKAVTTITRGRPCIIKWNSGDDVVDPEFNSVDGSRMMESVTNTGITSSDKYVSMRSTYGPLSATAGKLFDVHNTDNRGFHSYMTIKSPDGAGFRGWNTAADGSGAYVTTTIPFGTGGSFTLYSQVSPNSYVITAHSAAYAGQTHYWATFYHNAGNYRLPAGAQAFTMKSDKALYLVGDGSIIPAGCAVVIMADTESITLTLTDATATPEEGNILQGVAVDTAKTSLITGSEKVCVMGKSDSTFGFFEFSGTTVPAGKAYYLK